MIVQSVDPRDTMWEDDEPVYRVYLWHQPPAPAGISQAQMMYHCTEYRLRGAVDVHEVLAWVTTTARPDQTYTLYVEHRDEDRAGLIRLAGVDPTESG